MGQGRAVKGMPRLDGLTSLQGVWSAMAPLFQPWQPGRRPRRLRLASVPITDDDLSEIQKLSGPISVAIPETACLKREVTLPRAARAKAEQAIGLHLRGTLPAGGKGLIWRHRLKSEQGTSVTYSCAIVKESQLLYIREATGRMGARLTDIRLVGFDNPVLWDATPKHPVTAKNWAAGTGLVCVFLTVFVIVLTEAQVADVSAQVSNRSALVAQLEQRLAEVSARDARDATDDQLTATQLVEFEQGLRPLAGLGLVASALPPDVWISELSVAGGGWRLSGFSGGEVTETVKALQSLPGARNVRLSGPVMFDTFSRKNRFDIEMTLLPSAAP